VFEGGTHVPFFVRWPGRLKGDRDLDMIAAHIDVAPTLAAACGGAMPKDRTIDGRNLLPLWLGVPAALPERSLFFQWHRGNVPEMYRACAVRTQRWRLCQPDGVAEKAKFDRNKWMLFDIRNDPYEKKDVAGENAGVVAKLKKEYEAWFKDVASTRKFAPPRIVVGSDREPLTTLTRQDMRSTARSAGHWELRVEKAGKFDLTGTLLTPATGDAVLNVKVGPNRYTKKLAERDRSGVVAGIELPAGPITLEAWASEGDDSRRVLRFVEVRRSK
jgi:hypothetical protein